MANEKYGASRIFRSLFWTIYCELMSSILFLLRINQLKCRFHKLKTISYIRKKHDLQLSLCPKQDVYWKEKEIPFYPKINWHYVRVDMISIFALFNKPHTQLRVFYCGYSIKTKPKYYVTADLSERQSEVVAHAVVLIGESSTRTNILCIWSFPFESWSDSFLKHCRENCCWDHGLALHVWPITIFSNLTLVLTKECCWLVLLIVSLVFFKLQSLTLFDPSYFLDISTRSVAGYWTLCNENHNSF